MIDVTIAICTFKRPQLLLDCLTSLSKMKTKFTYEIIVVDNDIELSAKSIVDQFSNDILELGISVRYYSEPVQNIAMARNLGVANAKGDFIAFIDDDETADINWLSELYNMIINHACDGVWGPVIPIVPESFPVWLKNSGIFDSDMKMSGTHLKGTDCATNNALVKSKILKLRNGPFSQDMGRTGGSDIELFSWLVDRGVVFLWASNAIVYEKIEDKRSRFFWHIKRSYRTGWGLSKIYVERNGLLRSSIVIFLYKLPTSFIKGIFTSFLKFNNPKAFALLLCRNFAGQAGKIGYFLNFRIIEYKGM